MYMIYPATEIAKYIVQVAHENGDGITPLKLQKILYYVQGGYLALRGYPVFDEDILAWRHGPAVYSVYVNNKKYGSGEIPPESIDIPFSEFDKKFIREIYLKYRKYSAAQLIEMTHSEAPWKDTGQSDVIETDIIKEFFSKDRYTMEKFLADSPVVDKIPISEYDSSEDDEWDAYL
jgi:uncharacterized phage-associated protein